jgi:hypothetical protein
MNIFFRDTGFGCVASREKLFSEGDLRTDVQSKVMLTFRLELEVGQRVSMTWRPTEDQSKRGQLLSGEVNG